MDGPDIGNLIGRAHEDALAPEPERRRRRIGPDRNAVPPMLLGQPAAPIAPEPTKPQLHDIAASLEFDEPDVAIAPTPSPSVRATTPEMAPSELGPEGERFWKPRVPVGTITLYGVEIPVEADGRPILEPLDGRKERLDGPGRDVDLFE